MASHLEKQMARIEALVGQEEEPCGIVFLGRDQKPLPGQEPLWFGGTPETRAAASAQWKKTEAARVKKALKEALKALKKAAS